MAATDSKPKGGKPDKLIRDALMAAIRQEPDKLKRIAESWLERAMTEQSAATELANRIDGKAVQPLCGDDERAPIDANLFINFVKPLE